MDRVTLESWRAASGKQRVHLIDNVAAAAPSGFELIREVPDAGLLPMFVHAPTATEWMFIPGGSFSMGLSTEEENAARAIEELPPLNIHEMRPCHVVTVRPFLAMKARSGAEIISALPMIRRLRTTTSASVVGRLHFGRGKVRSGHSAFQPCVCHRPTLPEVCAARALSLTCSCLSSEIGGAVCSRMTAKQEAEQLLNDVLPLAKRMLAEFGEFHPFGGMLTSAGELVQVGADVGKALPSGRELIESMTAMFRDKASRGVIRAAALVLNVTVTPPQSQDETDAIEVRIDHQDGYCVHVFYPYVRTDRELGVASPFASKAVPFAFIS